MHGLKIPYVYDFKEVSPGNLGQILRSSGTSVPVSVRNWEEYSYLPDVVLYLGYTSDHLWLSFEVKADYFRAKALSDQEAVWEDSCVEFFMTTEKQPDSNYWNFEFNSLGTCLSAFGTKSERKFLPDESMKQILRFSSLTRENMPLEGACFDWQLAVAIPLKLVELEAGRHFRGNFYKCGDETKQPHFLSWKPVYADTPDFHLPQFFGEMELFV